MTEQRGPLELKVQGRIPAWAAGSLYRTGPGGCKVEDTKSGTFHISHWFDGLAHTHRFDIMAPPPADSMACPADRGDDRLAKTRVLYSSRRQADSFIKDIQATGRMNVISFAQRRDPCVGLFGKFMGMFQSDIVYENVGVTVEADLSAFQKVSRPNPSSNTAGHRAGARSLFQGTDTSVFAQADPATMEVLQYIGQDKLHPELKGQLGPAHGLRDPETGDYFSFNLQMGLSSVYRVFQVSGTTGETKILATIKEKPAYIHSFFLTRQYVILCVPVAHLQKNGARTLWEGNLLDAFVPFDAAETTRWFVVDRRGGRGVVARFASPACFFFHTTNAFEDEATGDIVCEYVRYPSTAIISGFYYDVLLQRDGKARTFWCRGDQPQTCVATLARVRLARTEMEKQAGREAGGGALPAPSVELEIPSPHAGDLPTFNRAYMCRPHRYTYCTANRGLSTLSDSLVKVDTATRDVLIWSGPKGHTPGEAIFVGRPRTAGAAGDDEGAPAEDDGVLLSVVLDGANRTSYLLCLDAVTMSELGRAECEFAVALGLHGQHVTS